MILVTIPHRSFIAMLRTCAAAVPLVTALLLSSPSAAAPQTDIQREDGTDLKLPKSMGERNSGFTYVPLDPLAVQVGTSNCGAVPTGTQKLMYALPDNAVRMAMQEVTADGSASFGPVTIGAKGKTYRVILDFVSVDTTNVRFQVANTSGSTPVSALKNIRAAERLSVLRMKKDEAVKQGFDEFVIPVYVGVGLRLTAVVTVREGKLNLAGLTGLGAAAEAKKASGSLIVQTLGINGPEVAAALPLPSELNVTTVQNAILSLGGIKSTLWSDKTRIAARVTGIYNPLPTGDLRLINGIVSELAKDPIPWEPCKTQAAVS
jgi:hypothetical protein